VQGVIGSSKDGSYVYFVATGILAADENSNKEKAATGEDNLYLRHDGATTFVAVLAPEDDKLERQEYSCTGCGFEAGDWQGPLGSRTAEVAPDGQGVVFESQRQLTGYESGFYGPHKRQEVFVYEAGAGRVFCVSCSPTGSPVLEGQVGEGIAEEDGGSYIPIHPSEYDGGDTAPVRWISANGGEVFFDTDQPLVPQDTNGVQDVYEWEREGGVDCPAQDPARLNGGCEFLISNGVNGDNYLIGASTSGGDVFFSTLAHLVPQAAGEKSAVYDARVDGGFPEDPLACTGTGCQGLPSAPPIFATPSSATFEGLGNFEPPSKAALKPKAKTKACGKGRVRRHGKCVRKGKGGKRSRPVKRSLKGGK
jgi:hypothetical protein